VSGSVGEGGGKGPRLILKKSNRLKNEGDRKKRISVVGKKKKDKQKKEVKKCTSKKKKKPWDEKGRGGLNLESSRT